MSQRMDKKLLEILACPVCKGDLIYKETQLLCCSCKSKYSIVNGIPVLLVEEEQKV